MPTPSILKVAFNLFTSTVVVVVILAESSSPFTFVEFVVVVVEYGSNLKFNILKERNCFPLKFVKGSGK